MFLANVAHNSAKKKKQPRGITTELIKAHIPWNLNITSCHLHHFAALEMEEKRRKSKNRRKLRLAGGCKAGRKWQTFIYEEKKPRHNMGGDIKMSNFSARSTN